MYGRLEGQRVQELNHVVTLVGGVHHFYRHAGTEGAVYVPVEKSRQKAAVDFLNRNAFHAPAFMLDPALLRLFESSGTTARMYASQNRVLNNLFRPDRIERLIEQEALLGSEAYSLEEMMADVRAGIWSELPARSVSINAFRRNLQRGWLNLMDSRLNGETAPDNDLKPLIRGELQELDTLLERARSRAADRISRLHIDDARARIADILNPE
jgi:hypothetical protein